MGHFSPSKKWKLVGGVGDFWISVRMMGLGLRRCIYIYIDGFLFFTWGIIGPWLCYLLMSD